MGKRRINSIPKLKTKLKADNIKQKYAAAKPTLSRAKTRIVTR